jgi:hypothetical protein
MGYLDVEAKLPKDPFDWKPWWLWVAANGLVGVANVGARYIVNPISDLISLPFWLRLILGSLLGSAVLGLLQGLVWRRYVPMIPLGSWVIVTMIGTLLGLVVGQVVTLPVLFLSGFCVPLSLIVPGAVQGAVVGLAQRRVLRRYFDDDKHWVRVNALAGALSLLPLYASVAWTLFSAPYGLSATSVGAPGTIPDATVSSFVGLGVFLSSLTLLYGAVTGGVFARLVRLYTERGQ